MSMLTQREQIPSPAAEVRTSILVVEDDVTIRELLTYSLRRSGFAVSSAGTGREGLGLAVESDVDLVLLDVMLPEGDGITVVRAIKEARPDLPVILLTACDDREVELAGFRAGADDYVTKPFDMDELLARIQARLPAASGGAPHASVVCVGGLELNAATRVLRSVSGDVHLRPKELALLLVFFSAPGRLFTREEIVERVWGHRYLPSSRTLDVHVGWLREKMAPLQENGPTIKTYRGVGYRLVEEGADC